LILSTSSISHSLASWLFTLILALLLLLTFLQPPPHSFLYFTLLDDSLLMVHSYPM
jgi:hypothetical protein